MAFVVGLWIRPSAALALFLILNFHFGTSALYAWEFLRDGTGPPVLAALVALVQAGLHFSGRPLSLLTEPAAPLQAPAEGSA